MTDITYIDKYYSYDGKLGVTLSESSTEFALWSPEAERVELLIYADQHAIEPDGVYPMLLGDRGVWRLTLAENMTGAYYTYRYTHGGIANEGVDIYAAASGCNGERGYICDLSSVDPEGWEDDRYTPLASYTDAVLYEAHIRDLSSDSSSGVSDKNRGRMGAFCESAVNSHGQPTVLDHIADLGVTHIHLLPAFDYDEVNEANPTAYNWGYNPKNYNIPEGSYSSDPFTPEVRIKEFKEMVKAIHDKGMGVVMDVVYNHTYAGDDSWFEIAYPHYYHRFRGNYYSNGSGCGNEMASEHYMCRRYIIDSVCHWAREYHVDGFRFDLMALIDIDTMNELTQKLKEINPNVIIYGEGWIGGDSTLNPYDAAFNSNAERMPNIAFFNDGYRDSVKGNTFINESKGYVAGNIHCRSGIISGLKGQIWWSKSPTQTVNYCEAHDNLTMWDKLCVSTPWASEDDKKKMARLSLALVFLAQGIPFIQAGQEFLRSKPLGNGRYDHNSYKSPDSVNSLKWDSLYDHHMEAEYVRGLIQFRKANSLLRMTSYEEIEASSEVFPSGDGIISLSLHNESEDILILVNPIPRAKMFVLPDGEWQVYVSDIKAGITPLCTYCEGVFVPPISVMVLKKKTDY